MEPTEELKKKALALVEHAIRLDTELLVLRRTLAVIQHAYHCEDDVKSAIDSMRNALGQEETIRKKYAQLTAEIELLAANQQGRIQ